MRVFPWLAVAGGLVFVGFAWSRLDHPDPALWVPVYGLVALVSFVAALERLHHRVAFALTLALAGLLWWTVDPRAPAEAGVVRGDTGLVAAMVWTLVLALVAQRVSARRLIEGA